jgi:hypothetical protein
MPGLAKKIAAVKGQLDVSGRWRLLMEKAGHQGGQIRYRITARLSGDGFLVAESAAMGATGMG